jgi:ribosomal-protein-alanine N-acetyltransferase
MSPVEVIETERLVLRRPRRADVPAIFERYASDPDATRFVPWPTHRTLDDTYMFLALSDGLWAAFPAAGPYLVFERDGMRLLGGAGVMVHDAATGVAVTGYILARDAWGRGYATESLQASVAVAKAAGLRRLQAGVYATHRQSCHVLEKAGFVVERSEPSRPDSFPNLPAEAPRHTVLYALPL